MGLVRKTISLPFQWLGQLAAMFGVPFGVDLLKMAWKIGGAGATAGLALAAIRKHHGEAAAGAQAGAWMNARPRPEIAVVAGFAAVWDGDLNSARDYLRRGRQAGKDRTGVLELLEMIIATHTGPGEAAEVAGRLEARHDLSASVSKLVLHKVLWSDLLAGRFGPARARADHLLAVAEDPVARMALWALELGEGRERQAGGHLGRAGLMSAESRLQYECLGYAAVGRNGEARAKLDQLRQANAGAARYVELALAGRGAAPWGS